MEVRIRGAHGGDRGPSSRQFLTFLNRNALQEVNELWTYVLVQRKRGTRREPHELHRPSICGAQIFDLYPFGKG